MAQIELKLPAMGEGIIEATLISWLKNEGDSVAVDENVIEVATDKVNSEVPSTVAGVLQKKLFGENDVIAVGQAFAIISTEGETTEITAAPLAQSPTPPAPTAQSSNEPKAKPEVLDTNTTPIHESAVRHEKNVGFLSPLVQNIIKTEGLTTQDLQSIVGTGKDGRITKEDVMNYIESGRKTQTPQAEAETSTPAKVDVPVVSETTQIVASNAIQSNTPQAEDGVPMDRMRKLISEHMIKSIQTSAHVCSFIEADVTNLANWRNKHKKAFMDKYQENLTFTPLLIEAIAKALIEFPILNSSTDGSKIYYKKDINIGMAAALPDGNLIVPVIKNADMLNLMGLAKKVNDLGKRAKAGQLKPDEIQGGTYTMTNLGSFGNLFGTPIINQPQVAILGVGAIVKKPVVLTIDGQDTIAIRSMMYLSHSYDHRIIDGYVGGMFVKRVAEILENFDISRSI